MNQSGKILLLQKATKPAKQVQLIKGACGPCYYWLIQEQGMVQNYHGLQTCLDG